jgi:hypothetical protein
MIRWWYSHMFLMLAAVMIGVALTWTVKIHYYDPYPIKYAIIWCIGLSLYILSLWSIESTLKRWSQGVISFTKVRILGIIIPILILWWIYLWLPSILWNAIFLLGITIQLLIPILLWYKMIFQKK